jgi:hypothetical protein
MECQAGRYSFAPQCAVKAVRTKGLTQLRQAGKKTAQTRTKKRGAV